MKILVHQKTEPISLTERIYRDLRLSIITGKLPGGTRLIESTLAHKMGASRTPIREALQRLSQEKLVYSIPRLGFIVEDMTEADIQDLFATRMEIELLVGRWALPKITEDEIDQLKNNLDKTDTVLKNNQTDKMIDLDIEFHHIIYKATRSKSLYQISKNISDHTLKFRLACIHIPEIANRARDDHRSIYNAFKSKDPKKVEATITDHLMVVKSDILDFLKRVREEKFLAQDI